MDIAYFHALHHHLSVNTTKASVASRLYISNVSFFYILYVYKMCIYRSESGRAGEKPGQGEDLRGTEKIPGGFCTTCFFNSTRSLSF